MHAQAYSVDSNLLSFHSLADKLLTTATISILEFIKSNEFHLYTGRIKS